MLLEVELTLLAARILLQFAFSLFFMCFFSYVLWTLRNATQGREKHKKRKRERESGREEGRRELRELIILFNHILDEGQVVCGTESETARGERG